VDAMTKHLNAWIGRKMSAVVRVGDTQVNETCSAALTETLREILARADARNGNQAVASGPLGADDYPTTARRLITTLRVAKVICRVNRLS